MAVVRVTVTDDAVDVQLNALLSGDASLDIGPQRRVVSAQHEQIDVRDAVQCHALCRDGNKESERTANPDR